MGAGQHPSGPGWRRAHQRSPPPRDLAAATTRTGDNASTPAAPSETVDRFALAHHVLALRETFAIHQSTIGQDAREALAAEMARAARDAEESIIRMMPWLDDANRGKAIDLLVDLRKALHDNAAQSLLFGWANMACRADSPSNPGSPNGFLPGTPRHFRNVDGLSGGVPQVRRDLDRPGRCKPPSGTSKRYRVSTGNFGGDCE